MVPQDLYWDLCISKLSRVIWTRRLKMRQGSMQKTELFGILKCAVDYKQLWKDLTVLSDEAIKSQIKFNENHK